jgi:transcription elongation factor Elf1
MNYSFTCCNCGEELIAEVNVGEHMVEWDEKCDNCGYGFTQEEVMKIYDNALTDCLGSIVDNAHERMKERYL